MKFNIPKQDLLDAVNKVKAVVSAKSALPILSHLLIEGKENQIQLTATDLKVSIECSVDCQVNEPGSMTVSSQRMSSILSELPDGDVSLELGESNVVTLTSGKIQTRLFSMSPDEFPPVRSFEGVEPIVLPQLVLKRIFNKTSFAISRDQARYNLTGLLFEINNGKLTTVATDGRRMSLYRENGIADGIDLKVIIPSKMILELERLLGDEGDVSVYLSENQAAFEFNTVRIVSALIEGNFPNYDMVVPKNHDKTLTINTNVFLEAVRRTRTMTNDKFNSVRFEIQDGRMLLRVVTPEVGEYEEELPLEFAGDPLEIAFNPDFVLDVLRHIETEHTRFVLKDAMSPGLIQPGEGDDGDKYMNVVMPIRI